MKTSAAHWEIKVQKKLYEDIISAYEKNNTSSASLTELYERAASLFGKEQTEKDPLETFNAHRLIEIAGEEILQQAIIGKEGVNISGLLNRLEYSDWVSNGRQYLEQSPDDTCPFCQQKVPQTLKQDLEDFFNQEYQDSMEKVMELRQEYQQVFDGLKAYLDKIKGLNHEYIDANALNHIPTALLAQLSANLNLLENKEKNLSSSLKYRPVSVHFPLNVLLSCIKQQKLAL